MTTALIVEDEPFLASELAELLQSLWPELTLAPPANNGLQALQYIFQHKPDIAFLDIQIPDPNGLEVARIVRDTCHIVFVTAYDQHAIEAFEKGAIDYLLKPISRERLQLTVQRLQQRITSPAPDLAQMLPSAPAVPQQGRYLRWITATIGQSLRL
ncbi:MAG: response regulator, partial [Burkholderiales bacterium]|nr:response regulator [Burkholderiales bacterium]